MSWRHAVVKRIHKHATGETTIYGIHEYYTPEEGEASKGSITTDPVDVSTEADSDEEALKGLRWTLEKMLKALDRPILNYEDFNR